MAAATAQAATAHVPGPAASSADRSGHMSHNATDSTPNVRGQTLCHWNRTPSRPFFCSITGPPAALHAGKQRRVNAYLPPRLWQAAVSGRSELVCQARALFGFHRPQGAPRSPASADPATQSDRRSKQENKRSPFNRNVRVFQAMTKCDRMCNASWPNTACRFLRPTRLQSTLAMIISFMHGDISNHPAYTIDAMISQSCGNQGRYHFYWPLLCAAHRLRLLLEFEKYHANVI
jgi:hypothetical protein